MKNEKGNMLVIGAVILGIVAVIGMYVFSKYNSFVTSEENIKGQWAQIENQLQRRFDLIPNLVETTKGFAAHEEEIFLKLAEARKDYGSANSVDEMAAANDGLSGALSSLLVIVENYPELKANEQFKALMVELSGTENRIAVARKDYNDAVQQYNGSVRRVPGSFIAGMFGFEQMPYFEVKDGVEEAPAVDFTTE